MGKYRTHTRAKSSTSFTKLLTRFSRKLYAAPSFIKQFLKKCFIKLAFQKHRKLQIFLSEVLISSKFQHAKNDVNMPTTAPEKINTYENSFILTNSIEVHLEQHHK